MRFAPPIVTTTQSMAIPDLLKTDISIFSCTLAGNGAPASKIKHGWRYKLVPEPPHIGNSIQIGDNDG